MGCYRMLKAHEPVSSPALDSHTKESRAGIMGGKSAARRAWRVARGNVDPRCDYCGVVTREDVAETHPQRATVEDIVPLSKGGLNNRSNWALACSACNQAKGASDTMPKKKARLAAKPKRDRCSRHRPGLQNHIDRILAEDQARRDRAAALGFTLYPPIPGVQDEAFR